MFFGWRREVTSIETLASAVSRAIIFLRVCCGFVCRFTRQTEHVCHMLHIFLARLFRGVAGRK